MSHQLGAERPTPPTWIRDVAALIAHDVGNSLVALSFLVAELRLEPSGDEQRGRLDDAETTLERASAAIALLGRLCTEANPPEHLDLRAVVAGAAPLLRNVGRRSLAIGLPDAPVHVRAARAGVERALFELALAAGHAPGAGARLSLEPARDGTARIALALDPGAARDATLDAAALPGARALADACGGRLSVADLAGGASRIEIALPTVG